MIGTPPETYVFGRNPMYFSVEQIDQLPAGRLLLPAEGEGPKMRYMPQRRRLEGFGF